MGADGLPWVWGTTGDEAARAYGADDSVPAPVWRITRAVDVAAPVATTWRWLCQLTVAPYSYDLVDNLGRRSPPELTPGTERLELGQTMVTILSLSDVDEGHAWTGVTGGLGVRLFGPVAMTYAAEPGSSPSRSRIVGRLAVPGRTRAQRARAWALAWGDLPMMRKQLLTLASYAERDASREQ